MFYVGRQIRVIASNIQECLKDPQAQNTFKMQEEGAAVHPCGVDAVPV